MKLKIILKRKVKTIQIQEKLELNIIIKQDVVFPLEI